jgi:hypothetical protein
MDAALNCCNKLDFERRVSHYFRQSLWYELLLRYLDPVALEQSVMSVLQPRQSVLEPETALEPEPVRDPAPNKEAVPA